MISLAIALVVASGLILPAQSRAQETDSALNQLVVYGTGRVEAPADRAVFSFSVKGFGPSLDSAITVARGKVQNLTSQLFSIGLTHENITTSKFHSGDNFEGKAFWSSSKDFRAMFSVSVRVDSLDLLEPAVVAISKGSVESLSSVRFVLRDDEAAKLDARRQAVNNATEKAQLMSGTLNLQLGRVLHVEELLSYDDGDFYLPEKEKSPRVVRYSATNAASAPSGRVLFGQSFSKKSGVKVIFEILRPPEK